MGTPTSTPRKDVAGRPRDTRPSTPAGLGPSRVTATSPFRKFVTPANGSAKKTRPVAEVLFETPSKQVVTPDPIKRMGGLCFERHGELDNRKGEVKTVLGSDTPVLAVPPKCSKDLNKYIITGSPSFTPPGPVPVSTIQLSMNGAAGGEEYGRKSSYDMGDFMAGVKDHTTEHEPRSPTPTLLRKASEKLGFKLDTHSKAIMSQLIKELVEHQSPLPTEARNFFSVNTGPQKPKSCLTLFPSRILSPCSPEPTDLPYGSPSRPRRELRRAGTDPLVLLAMRKEMEQIKKKMRNTVGPDYSRSGEMNAFVLPEMQSMPAKQETAVKQPGAPSAAKRPKPTLALRRPSISFKQPNKAQDPEQSKKSSKANIHIKRLGPDKKLPQTRLPSNTNTKLPNKPVVKRSAPSKPTPRYAITKPPARKTPAMPPKTTTPKPTTTTNHLPSTTPPLPPYARPTKSSAAQPAGPKRPTITNTFVKKKPSTLQPVPISDEPAPNFASALDIANQVRKWNNVADDHGIPGSPDTTAAATTPPGKTSKPTATPGKIGKPTTPAQTSRIATLDPNAFRTPSKRIQSALDRAIDRKIEEDARSGREFTAGGNRIRDLLRARETGGSE